MLGSATYSVSKHAALAYAEWLSATYAHRGITVQAVCPLGVNTRMIEEAGPMREVLAFDPILEPQDVAEAIVQGMAGEDFLILPHPQVAAYYRARANDPDRWLAGMRSIQARIDATP
jgi:NAD(P)-dependent dehydrogenase (short-subunit alcohol dehydrogenase family)